MTEYDRGINPGDFTPVKRRTIEEMFAGRQLARLVYFRDPSRFNSAQVGIRLTDSDSFLILSGPAAWFRRPLPVPYAWRLAVDAFERLHVVYPSLYRELHSTRRQLGEKPEHIQERVEGALILGVPTCKEPTADLGEQIRFELNGGMNLYFQATPGEGGLTAGITLQLDEGVDRSVFVMPQFRPPSPSKPTIGL